MSERDDDTIRIATFNIKHGAYQNKYIGHARKMAEACASLEVDILALQEVDKGVVRSGFYDMARLAARAAGMVPYFAPTLKYKIGEYGNALLVKGDLLLKDHKTYEGGTRFNLGIGSHAVRLGREPRNAIFARARVKNKEITIVATHLSTQKDYRTEQLGRLLWGIPSDESPLIVAGDFNMNRKDALPYFTKAGMELIESEPTFPADSPRRSIDHIAIRGLSVQSVRTVEMPISDHRAVIADVR